MWTNDSLTKIPYTEDSPELQSDSKEDRWMDCKRKQSKWTDLQIL